jgi:hypothetical protein
MSIIIMQVLNIVKNLNIYSNTLFILYLVKLSFRIPACRQEIFISPIDSFLSNAGLAVRPPAGRLLQLLLFGTKVPKKR